MVEIAKEYYFAEKNKSEIGSLYHCSSTQIARMLKIAKDRGLVEVKIREAGPGTPSELEHRLRQRFPHLLRVVVVQVDKNPYSQLAGYRTVLERMAAAASDLFEELVDDVVMPNGTGAPNGNGHGSLDSSARATTAEAEPVVRRIGFGGGKTIFELISRIPVRDRPDVHFYPMALLGRGPGATVALDPQTLCLSAWARSGMMPDNCHYVTIPPYFHRRAKKQCEELANTSYVKEQLKAASEIDCAFFTLGAIRHELLPNNKDPQSEITKYFSTQLLLKDVGVPLDRMGKCAGEVCYSFFDSEGREMPEHRYFLSMGADFLAKMVRTSSGAGTFPGPPAEKNRPSSMSDESKRRPRYAVMIAGSYKLEAVRAALNGRICNCWITDESCARDILAG